MWCDNLLKVFCIFFNEKIYNIVVVLLYFLSFKYLALLKHIYWFLGIFASSSQST